MITIASKTKKTIFIVFIGLVVVGFIAFVYFKLSPIFIWNGVKYTRNSSGKIVSAERLTPLKTTQPQDSTINSSTNNELVYWEIVDTSSNPVFPTGLRLFEGNTSDSSVLKWKNLLIGYNQEFYVNKSSGAFLGATTQPDEIMKNIRSVRIFNIDTGETFDISLEKPTWGEIWYTTSQIVGDSYYFGVGGAFGASLGYRLELPPTRTSKITKLKAGIGNELTKVGNFYIGSSCYEGCVYSLFNPEAQTSTELKRLTDATNEKIFDRKEEFVGFDKNGNIILNIREIPQNSNGLNTFYTQEIDSVPLNNESTTNTLIKAKDFPEKISKTYMIDGQQKILMLSDTKAYFYNIDTNKFIEVKNIPINENLTRIFKQQSANLICFSDSNNYDYVIDFEKEEYSKDITSCRPTEEQTSVQTKFANLKLPKNFELIQIKTNYTKVNQ